MATVAGKSAAAHRRQLRSSVLRLGRALVGLVVLALLGGLGCPRTNQSLVLIGSQRVDGQRIDAEPLDVLPSGALLVGKLDGRALFRTPLGAQVARITNRLLPLGPESNFVPSRDVQRVVGAVYAMQGADFCAVLQGRFDTAAIERAARSGAATPSGAPVVATMYAGNVMYTVANIGFVVLTPRTILSGNETGMRRALDRLRFGRLAERALPEWMREVLDRPEAELALVGDLSAQPVVEGAAEQFPFLGGLRFVRALGNFRYPGLNVVGGLTYRDETAAAQGAASLAQVHQLASLLTVVTTFGLGPVPQVTVQQQGRDVAWATSIDGSAVQVLLAMLAQHLGT